VTYFLKCRRGGGSEGGGRQHKSPQNSILMEYRAFILKYILVEEGEGV